MAKITPPQNVPSELEQEYYGALGMAKPLVDGSGVNRRYPWKLPHMQGNGVVVKDPDIGAGVTDLAWQHRSIFKQSCNCFNIQLDTPYAPPPPTGPRSKEWWYDEALGSGMYYYNYFMQQTINAFIAAGTPAWCKLGGIDDSYTLSFVPNYNGNGDGFLPVSWAGQGIESWIKKPATGLTIHLLVADSTDPDGFDAPNNLWIRAVGDDWTEATLTFNNRPPYLNDLGILKVTGAAMTWYSFTVPSWVKAISLLVNPGAGRVTVLPHEVGGIYWT